MSDVRRFDGLVTVVADLRRQLEQLRSTTLNRLATHTHYLTGVVDPAYTTGKPKVTLAGADGLTAAGLDRLSSYTPTASDPVLVAVTGDGGYVVLGKVV